MPTYLLWGGKSTTCWGASLASTVWSWNYVKDEWSQVLLPHIKMDLASTSVRIPWRDWLVGWSCSARTWSRQLRTWRATSGPRSGRRLTAACWNRPGNLHRRFLFRIPDFAKFCPQVLKQQRKSSAEKVQDWDRSGSRKRGFNPAASKEFPPQNLISRELLLSSCGIC